MAHEAGRGARSGVGVVSGVVDIHVLVFLACRGVGDANRSGGLVDRGCGSRVVVRHGDGVVGCRLRDGLVKGVAARGYITLQAVRAALCDGLHGLYLHDDGVASEGLWLAIAIDVGQHVVGVHIECGEVVGGYHLIAGIGRNLGRILALARSGINGGCGAVEGVGVGAVLALGADHGNLWGERGCKRHGGCRRGEDDIQAGGLLYGVAKLGAFPSEAIHVGAGLYVETHVVGVGLGIEHHVFASCRVGIVFHVVVEIRVTALAGLVAILTEVELERGGGARGVRVAQETELAALGQGHGSLVALLVLVVDQLHGIGGTPIGKRMGQIAVQRRAYHEDAKRGLIVIV